MTTLCDYCGHSTTHYDHTACTPEAEAARDTDHGDPGPDLPEQVAGWTVPDTTNEENERMSTTGYEHQAIDHDASIRAERPDPDQVEITITHGEDEPTSITMWAEDFETMAGEVAPEAQAVGDVTPAVQMHTAEDILDARRWFAYSYWERGSGFFVDSEAAESLFDSIASGFTTEHVHEWAESMRRADDGGAA